MTSEDVGMCCCAEHRSVHTTESIPSGPLGKAGKAATLVSS